jgi:hypothetical protein
MSVVKTALGRLREITAIAEYPIRLKEQLVSFKTPVNNYGKK